MKAGAFTPAIPEHQGDQPADLVGRSMKAGAFTPAIRPSDSAAIGVSRSAQ